MHASSRDDAAGKRTTPPVQPQITTFSDAFSLLQATHLWFPRMNDLLPFNDLRALRRVSRGLRDSMPRGHFNLLSLAYQFQQPCLKFAGFVYKEAGSTEAGCLISNLGMNLGSNPGRSLTSLGELHARALSPPRIFFPFASPSPPYSLWWKESPR